MIQIEINPKIRQMALKQRTIFQETVNARKHWGYGQKHWT